MELRCVLFHSVTRSTTGHADLQFRKMSHILRDGYVQKATHRLPSLLSILPLGDTSTAVTDGLSLRHGVVSLEWTGR